jgi:hypothetical protein
VFGLDFGILNWKAGLRRDFAALKGGSHFVFIFGVLRKKQHYNIMSGWK